MAGNVRLCQKYLEVELDCEKLSYTTHANGRIWRQTEEAAPRIILKNGRELLFSDADGIHHEHVKSGVGEGILSHYEWMNADRMVEGSFSLETFVWIEFATQAVHFELIPGEGSLKSEKICWPGAFFYAGKYEDGLRSGRECTDSLSQCSVSGLAATTSGQKCATKEMSTAVSAQECSVPEINARTSGQKCAATEMSIVVSAQECSVPEMDATISEQKRAAKGITASYTVLPLQQGLLIPDNWEHEVRKLPFDGQFCSAAAYMPWFGQVADGCGYIAICETPWDAGYEVEHRAPERDYAQRGSNCDAGCEACYPAGGPHTRVEPYFLSSLGELSYRRCLRYVFLESCDYNDLCKVYRSYVRETGLFTTLREKAARNPHVDDLIGSVIVHKGIKTHVSPDSMFYDPEHPEKNDVLVPFSARTREILRYHDMGVRKLYLHLDGWGAPGYDNQHPDYLPACPEAGGWEGMKELSDTIADCGYLFGLHDQYRDYYTDAASYDREYAVHGADGTVFEMSRWAGGRQNYLCATQAPYYVKRNFEEVLGHGIRLQASYLDVFTCNEPDECAHPRHRMTRKECLEYREACFAYLTSKGILPSSEECGDWAMRELVFCHYGPYDFMLDKPGSPRRGIPVPLFNLVYHDCMILPWFMDRQEVGGIGDNGETNEVGESSAHGETDEDGGSGAYGETNGGGGRGDNGETKKAGKSSQVGEDYMLYALLNGGVPYLDRDGAYPDTDGAFDSAAARKLAEEIDRCAQVTALHERVAKCEMVRHEFLDGDPAHQRTTYSDGTQVTVWLDLGEYEICYP